jgi:hypothetical protein
MFVDDLLNIRAHMSTGTNRPKSFSPSSKNSSAASTPDNRSLTSQKKKNILRRIFGSQPQKPPMYRGVPVKMMI